MRLNALGLILKGLEQLVQVNFFGIHSVTRVRQKFAGKIAFSAKKIFKVFIEKLLRNIQCFGS